MIAKCDVNYGIVYYTSHGLSRLVRVVLIPEARTTSANLNISKGLNLYSAMLHA